MAMLNNQRVIASQQAPSGLPTISAETMIFNGFRGHIGCLTGCWHPNFGPSGDALHCRSVKMIRGICIGKSLMSLGYQIRNAFMQNLSIWAYEIDILHLINPCGRSKSRFLPSKNLRWKISQSATSGIEPAWNPWMDFDQHVTRLVSQSPRMLLKQ